MKSGVIVTAAAGLIVAGGLAATFLRTAPTAAMSEARVAPGRIVVEVDDLSEHPERYDGRITVPGVVAGVSRSNRIFGVVDAREYDACGITTCAKYTMPVHTRGALPEPGATLLLTGRILKRDNGFVFEAERVEPAP